MEDVIIVSIVFSFGAFIATGIYKLIRLKIEGNTGADRETFNRLAKAFMQHKRDTERRLQNLEAIISEEHAEGKPKQISEPKDTIEIEEDEPAEEKRKESNDSKLKNMLKN